MDPILTDAALDVPQIQKGVKYVEQLFFEVLEEANEHELLTSFQKESADFRQQHLAKVYSIYFQLCNIVEEYTVISYRKILEDKHGSGRISGLFGQAFQTLAARNISPDKILELLAGLSIEPVFTAHPTESKRTTVLEQLHQLYEHYARLNNYGESTAADEREASRKIKLALHRLWRTGEVYLIKPAVQDELRNIVHYLTRSLPHAIEGFDNRLVSAWQDSGHEIDILKNWSRWPKIAFGDWVGGDRDGHPFVTSDVTRETLLMLRNQALSMILERIESLTKRLSFSEEWMPTPPQLLDRITQMVSDLGRKGERAVERNAKEPWRQYLNLVKAKLPVDDRTEAIHPLGFQYRDTAELIEDLSFLYEQLVSANAKPIADSEIIPVIRIAQTFGFHLAKLDIRQNSRFHDLAISQLMMAANISDGENFPSWNEEERLQFLMKELQSPRPFVKNIEQVGSEAQQAVKTLKVVRDYIRAFGDQGIGSLIVSMTRQTSDLLVVYLLAREAGLICTTPEGWYCPVQVVPLFETIDDLHRSEGILDLFFSIPTTQVTLRTSGSRRVQQVMIGYSDSNKDGGIFSSLWSLQEAQKKLVTIGKKHNIDILFFHGRGGSVSRGAGPTHRFIASCPPEALRAGLRITEQGEVISQKYARLPTAIYNLEVQVAGLLMQRVNSNKTNSWLEGAASDLSRRSFKAYERLIAQPGFIAFFSEATPIDVIEMSGIGSRPARRTGQRTLADLRAIPWAFSWSQSRIYIPAWYGTGTALASFKKDDSDAFDRLRREWASHSGLHYIITNVTSALILADRDIMKEYASLVSDLETKDRILQLILEEYDRTREMIQELLGSAIQERRPGMSKMMDFRNKKLHILHEIQVNQLREWRALKASGNEERVAAMLPALLQVVNAIAGGLRATG